MDTTQLNRYLGNMQQCYSLRKVTVAEGKAKGTGIIEVSTSGGLQIDILPDTGLDIGQVRYKGINMTYISYPDVYPSTGRATVGRKILCSAFTTTTDSITS